MLGTVTRAGKLLDLFTEEQPSWGATAAARELGIAKSQAYELLVSLAEIGLLRRLPAGQYRLGWRTLALGRDVLRSQFPREALQVVRGLSMRYEEPVHLVALDRDRLAFIARHSGRRETDGLLPTRSLDPYMHCCAIARCLIADAPDSTRRQVIDQDLGRYTPSTIIERLALLRELDHVRTKRIAFDAGEVHADLRAVAVPITDADGDTIAALGIWTTATRWARVGSELTCAIQGTRRRIESIVRTERAHKLGAEAMVVPASVAA